MYFYFLHICNSYQYSMQLNKILQRKDILDHKRNNSKELMPNDKLTDTFKVSFLLWSFYHDEVYIFVELKMNDIIKLRYLIFTGAAKPF